MIFDEPNELSIVYYTGISCDRHWVGGSANRSYPPENTRIFLENEDYIPDYSGIVIKK